MEPLPVSAVVVNLDGGDLLFEALDALGREGPEEIIVVDNGSGPEEISRLAAKSGLNLIRLAENRGFAGPANLGARAARTPFLAFVNNDCVLEGGYLCACLSALSANLALAAVQGAVLAADGLSVDGWGVGWSARAEAVQLGHGEVPPPPSGPLLSVPGISATAALFRRDVFLAAGGFAESFFAWYEDVDLSLRLRRAGARFACVPGARARHAGTATGRRRPVERWSRLFANRLRTLRRNFDPAALPARLLIPAAGASLGPAAEELGWPRALAVALGARHAAHPYREEDRAVLAALPPLRELPA
ncbi:MAG: glycosyltransferase family 2 protein [Acidithiobacillales bacterium]